MGKRKYDDIKDETSKKVKTSHKENENQTQPQNENNHDENEVIIEGNDVFDVKHFRKELTSKQGQTMVLTQFLQVCLNPDSPADYLLQYLKIGGNSHEILRQITQDSKKNLTLATPAFHIFHLIILKVQSSLPHMITITEEACRYFLNTFSSTIEIMISENSGPRHRKIVLKLLTSIVTLNSDLGVEVLNQAPLTAKHLQHLVEKPNYKEKDNVRSVFVLFMTSFLVEGHLPLIKALLEKQGLLGLIIPGLVNDEPESVMMFLNILKKNVVENSLISKSLKLKTFSHQVLHNLFKVYSWKGPPEFSVDSRNEAYPEIVALVTDIILTLFTSHKLGLYFIDKSLGTTDANKNQNLYKALLMLRKPWGNKHEGDVILDIIYKCPDIHRAIVNVIEQNFEPQNSLVWKRTADFTIQLLDKLKAEDMVDKMSQLNPVQVTNFVRFISLPVPLLKHIQMNLEKDFTVSLYCIKVLVKMLQTLKRYIQILEMAEPHRVVDLKHKLEYFFPKHLPAPAIVVSLIHNVISGKGGEDANKSKAGDALPKVTETNALILLVDLLLLYSDIHPSYFETLEGTLDMKQLLDFSITLKNNQTPVLKFKIVSLWLKIDNSAISLKNPMFKSLFLIMIDVYMSQDDIWLAAKETLWIFLKNTGIFESDEDEIHLVLYTLRNSKVNSPSIVGDIVEYVLQNIDKLTGVLRNHLEQLEISSQKNEDSLNKLFSDLMENRTADDTVFLETKIPSPFVLGCIEFMQSNKGAKNCLSNFLSLYVANLLHCNYSPELTEMLLGDFKSDVRSYVTNWLNQSISLPETIGGYDVVLKNISNAIIDNDKILIKDVIPFVEDGVEEGDIIIDNISYKINLSRSVDSSELLIWSKYLIFCTIRLANMCQLTEKQQNDIYNYFQTIITIGRKHLMLDVCRTMILTLFKNPQFLKIYKPFDTDKDNSILLASEFLLKVIDENKDIVEYLNKKQNILKSYQQKSFNEIKKVFLKIKKRKTMKGDFKHSIRILETIGMSNEHDIKAFNLIFNIEKDAYFNDTKEPTIVLELFRHLIEKYSKTISLELPVQIVKKSITLYTDLLSSKDVSPNLTDLEIALTQYFQTKPHQSLRLSETDFEKIFSSTAVRKSTANLASVILKSNVKFCNVFKKQICRSEVLTQRELTLPLGNASIHHKQFFVQNKDVFLTIYNEYKPNIMKMLEKPHKAGQIYTSCWQFIKKLSYECMEYQDCVKLFSKIHKFEVVELSHVAIFQSIFLKVLVAGEEFKNEYLTNYFITMFNSLIVSLKENKLDVIGAIISALANVVEIVKNRSHMTQGSKEQFKKILENPSWQNVCKAILKDSLKIKTIDQPITLGPKLLGLLTCLLNIFYPEDHEDIVTLFDMVTSHSEFLNVMLSHHSSHIKSRLIEFLYNLIRKNKSVMKAQQVPVYLSSYHATKSPCDRLILALLHHYETNGLPVNEYKPYVWGDSAANHYAVRKNRSASLWAHPTANQVLSLFDKDIIERTVRNFPVTQKLIYHYEIPSVIDANEVSTSVISVIDQMFADEVFKSNHIKDTEAEANALIYKGKYERILNELKDVELLTTAHLLPDDSIYDPAFLFPLLSHLLAPGSVASCFKMLRSGLLSVPVMALSSQCSKMRASAYHVLHRFCMLLETETRNKNDKLFLTDFINTLRHSLTTAIVRNGEDSQDIIDVKNPKLPAIDALYLARALMVSTAPFDPLYKPVNNFLIAKQFVDLSLVPDFLSLFHDSDVESAERRVWVLDVIRDGVKTMADINVIFKTMCLKMVMDFYSSVLSDKLAKEKILGVLGSIVSVPRGFVILVEGYGLLSWLHCVVREVRDKKLIKGIFRLLRNMIYSMIVASFASNIAAKDAKINDYLELRTNKDVELEILVMAYDLLKHVNDLEIEDIVDYVNIFGLISKRSLKSLSKKQMLGLVSTVGHFYDDCETIRLLVKVLTSKETVILQSQNMIANFDCQHRSSIMRELTKIVQCYVA